MILRMPLSAVGEAEIYAHLPGVVPDGLAFGVSGRYVGCYTPDTILVVSPDRRVEVLVSDPLADLLNRPTNLAFAPDGAGLCYANLGGHHLGVVSVEEGGAPLVFPSAA